MKFAWFKQACVVFAAMVCGVYATPAASAADPASATISNFYATLTDSMQHGKELGMQGRMHKLAPAIDAAFNIPLMAQFTVGPSWAAMPQADRDAVIAAFRRYTITDYARNFDSYNGQHFTIDPNVIVREPDHIVQTKLIPAKGDPVALNYRMRQTGAAWKIVDVFLDGFVSELSTRRSDYASTVAAGGGVALAKKLDALSDDLAK